MANISTRPRLSDIADADKFFVQDISDLTEGATGKSKQTLFSDIQTFMKREIGHVKVNTGNSLKPSLTLAANVSQVFDYVLPLGISSFPTTTFPMMVTAPQTSDIYDDTNNSFLENLVSGQFHSWRLELNYTGKANNQIARIIVTILNPLSGFTFPLEVMLSDAETSGSFGVLFQTIADSASLSPPLGTGSGYRFQVESDKSITMELDSLVRRSEEHDPNATDRGFVA